MKAIIGQECDGWTVIIGEKQYGWNHNEEDLGCEALKELLTDLGYDVEMEEWY